MKMRKLLSVICLALLTIPLSNCQRGDRDVGENNDGKPVLFSISPQSKVSHLPTFTLHTYGTNFTPESKIVFSDIEKPTAFINSTELTCLIDPDDTLLNTSMVRETLSFSGIKGEGQTVQVLVRSPAAVGGDSNTLDFFIYSNHRFNEVVTISDLEGNLGYPSIAVDEEGDIHVAWNDKVPGGDRGRYSIYDIYFSRSSDNGDHWTQALNISNNEQVSLVPAIAVGNFGNICAAWISGYYLGHDLFFRDSNDNGAGWGQVIKISNMPGDSLAPVIAIDSSGHLYVAWANYDYNLFHYDIYFSYSTDNGATWSQEVNISNNPVNSTNPTAAVDNTGNIYVAWMDDHAENWKEDIYFSRSIDNGINWTPALNLSNTPERSRMPAAAVDSAGNIDVVWMEDPSDNYEEEIYFTRSTDNGTNWTPMLNLSDNPGESRFPAIAVDSVGNINVVWEDSTPGNPEIYFTRSIDNGATWSPAVNISATPGNSKSPAFTIDSAGNFYITWVEETSTGFELCFKTTTR
jgi:hypothetical protein